MTGRFVLPGFALACAGALLFQGIGTARAPAQQPGPTPRAAPGPRTAPSGSAAAPALPVSTVRVVARYPHDASAFTEGLIWLDGALYESVGQEGRSDVRRVNLADGKVMARATIPVAEFGEGLAAWRGTLISLTWKHGLAHRWDARTLKPLGTFRYTGEGWGLTSTADSLVMSDGTPTLRFLDPRTFAEKRRVTVTLNGKPLPQVNELEMVGNELFANIWHSAFIVRIDPATGRVGGVIDLRPLIAEVAVRDPEGVANGIAWDAEKRRLFVTGKLWPTVFEVEVVEQP